MSIAIKCLLSFLLSLIRGYHIMEVQTESLIVGISGICQGSSFPPKASLMVQIKEDDFTAT